LKKKDDAAFREGFRMRALLISALAATLAGCTCLARFDHVVETPLPFNAENANYTPSTNTRSVPPDKSGKKTNQITKKAKYSVAGKMMPLRSDQPKDTSDPVIEKMKATIAAMMEDPASSTFSEMKRVVTNLLGERVEAICGHVRGKHASRTDTAEMPFVFIIANDEAYIVDGISTTAATAHRNICN